MLDQCKISMKEWGGKASDYRHIHDFIDQVDRNLGSEGRYLLHHCMGPFIVEKRFGIYITNSDGKKIPTRSIAEEHIKAEFNGHIPTVAMWLDAMDFKPWMMGGTKEQPNKQIMI